MINVNEYFDGKVKSLGYEDSAGKSSVGVMAPGEYTFGTATKEIMKVVSGELVVQLPGSDEWKSFKAGDEFVVEKDLEFHLKVSENSAYLCEYK